MKMTMVNSGLKGLTLTTLNFVYINHGDQRFFQFEIITWGFKRQCLEVNWSKYCILPRPIESDSACHMARSTNHRCHSVVIWIRGRIRDLGWWINYLNRVALTLFVKLLISAYTDHSILYKTQLLLCCLSMTFDQLFLFYFTMTYLHLVGIMGFKRLSLWVNLSYEWGYRHIFHEILTLSTSTQTTGFAMLSVSDA